MIMAEAPYFMQAVASSKLGCLKTILDLVVIPVIGMRLLGLVISC
jgi:hypothetical protein